jgi:alpha,alpha-trehalose-phosphate synthase [UDP-forming]
VGAVHDFVVVANRLPVDEARDEATGSTEWRPSPGGLVTALLPVMRSADGAWVGWTGAAGAAPEPFDADGLRLVPVGLTDAEVADHYAGFANATLWPLYHDAIVAPEFHRAWWQTYQQVNQRFADAASATAADAATVWVHDYQLQLVPAMLRAARPDLRIGFFNHIPFPGYEIFAQLPWRRQIIEGLLGADLLGFQRQADVTNFLRACRRAANMTTRGRTVHVPPAAPERRHGAAALTTPEMSDTQDRTRTVRAAGFPIAIDTASLETLARREDVRARAKEIRHALGDPRVMLLGVDRLDYTKGILHRLKAYGELLDEGRLKSPEAVLVQIASPSRERVEHYQRLRVDVEATVGRINGDHGVLGHPAVHYLHQSYPREEMAALYLAADLMLVTSLRDGMNLVAKEYVACRIGDSGALVLSEFTGAADELTGAFLVNPHDIDGLKDRIEQAALVSPAEARRRMRSMRRRVTDNDVARWAAGFLDALRAAAGDPALRASAKAER